MLQKTSKGYKFNVFRACAIYFPIIFIIFIGTQVTHYSGLPYEIDQINVHLSHALKTNNIDAKIVYMEETLGLLAPYTGNSGWIFPTEVTDIGSTKGILKASIDEIKTEESTQEESRWAFLPHNELNDYLNLQVEKSHGRISHYADGYMTNGNHNPALYIGLILLLGGIPLMAIVDNALGGGWENTPRYFFAPKKDKD